MRMRRTANIIEKIKKMAGIIILDPENYKGKWHQLFGNCNPIRLELGMGKGAFIAALASKDKACNHLGMERVPDIVYKAAQREEIKNIINTRLLFADVENLLYFFANGEIDRIYLNFSDPWPKTRHEKRRLTHTDFLNIYKKILKKDGEIFFKTDDKEFFDYSLQSLIEAGFSLHKITYDLQKTLYEDNIMTEYEQKFAAVDKPICRCEAIVPFCNREEG